MSTYANSKSQDEMQHNLHFIRLYTVCKDKTIVGKKEYTLFFFFFLKNYNLTP